MAVSELHGEYVRFIDERIKGELTGCKNYVWRQAWDIVQGAAIDRSLNLISSEELETVFKKVFETCPQFEESLKKKLEEQFSQVSFDEASSSLHDINT